MRRRSRARETFKFGPLYLQISTLLIPCELGRNVSCYTIIVFLRINNRVYDSDIDSFAEDFFWT